MALDLFISHSSKDMQLAEALIELLRAACPIPPDRIRCTSVNGYKLPIGASTDSMLRQEVHEAKTFIGLITPASIQSAYVSFELGARWGAGLHLAPVLACGANASYLRGPLSGINALRCDSTDEVHQFVGDIARALDLSLNGVIAYHRYIDKIVLMAKTVQIVANGSSPQISSEPKSTIVTDLNATIYALEHFHSNPEGIYYIGQTLLECYGLLESLNEPERSVDLIDPIVEEIDNDERKNEGLLDPIISVSKVRSLIKFLKQKKKELKVSKET